MEFRTVKREPWIWTEFWAAKFIDPPEITKNDWPITRGEFEGLKNSRAACGNQQDSTTDAGCKYFSGLTIGSRSGGHYGTAQQRFL
jgi:hypothetical protein